MLKRYPLTILLVIATVVVDVVLISIHMPMYVEKRALLAGLLFGQMGVLAMWAAWGGGHRLTRVSTMVVSACLIGLASGGKALLGTYHWLAILVGYTLAVYLASIFVATVKRYLAQRSGEADDQPTWQVSLMELFGWTILVAIVSFAARSMDFSFVRPSGHVIEKTLLVLAIPIAFAAHVKNDLSDLNRGSAFRIVYLSLVAITIILLRLYEPRLAIPLLASQAGYLVLWFFVRGLDDLMTKVKTIEAPLVESLDNRQEADTSNKVEA